MREMLTKNEIKRIKSLQSKKYRTEYQRFVVEGFKSVEELINSDIEVEQVIVSSQVDADKVKYSRPIIVKPSVFKSLSAQKQASGILAVAKIPQYQLNTSQFGKITLVLDQITDPGNLGTIIRTCDWFGIKHIVCSTNTVDAYNPKVIQATMGSFARVKVFYTDIQNFLMKETGNVHILGLDMDGVPLQKAEVGKEKLFIIVGNEAHGISREIANIVDGMISIPMIERKDSSRPESLNASVAAR